MNTTTSEHTLSLLLTQYNTLLADIKEIETQQQIKDMLAKIQVLQARKRTLTEMDGNTSSKTDDNDGIEEEEHGENESFPEYDQSVLHSVSGVDVTSNTKDTNKQSIIIPDDPRDGSTWEESIILELTGEEVDEIKGYDTDSDVTLRPCYPPYQPPRTVEEQISRTVYICFIDGSATERGFGTFMSRAIGGVTRCKLCGDARYKTRFGFIEFYTAKMATRAIKSDPLIRFKEHRIKIMATTKIIRDHIGTCFIK